MSKTSGVKRRIRSVKNTQQITRTMEMVATSKLKKASDRVTAARPYGEALREIVQSLHNPELAGRFPLLRQPERVERAAVLVLTSDRGLAGAFNVNILRRARDLIGALRDDGVEVEVHVVGKKGIGFFRFQREPLASTRTDMGDYPEPDEAAELVDGLRDSFEKGEIDQLWIVHSEFRSALSTPPVAREVLPLRGSEEATPPENYILKPSTEGILRRLLPLYVRNAAYRALVENIAAEQGARRTAMKNATDNAGDMLDSLRRSYNRARQAQITQEIAEIVGGAAAFE